MTESHDTPADKSTKPLATATVKSVTATYRGPSDALVLSDGSVLAVHVAAEADPQAVEAARAAGHNVE